MNKDKVIKDLKERNDSLNNQYRLRNIRCVYLENEVQEQKKEIERLNGIIQIKQNRIDKLNKKLIRRDNIIEDLKAILKSKGYETYIPILERSDKE